MNKILILIVLILVNILIYKKNLQIKQEIYEYTHKLATFEEKVQHYLILKKRWKYNKKYIINMLSMYKKYISIQNKQDKLNIRVTSSDPFLIDKIFRKLMNSYIKIYSYKITKSKKSITLEMEINVND